MWLELTTNKPKNNTMVKVAILDKKLFVANIEGKLFCANNLCPHEGIELTLGCIQEQRIKCSLHGFSFDLNTGNSDELGVENLNVYPIKEQNGKIWIKV